MAVENQTCKFSVIFCFEEKKDKCLISIIISVPSSLISLNLCLSDVFSPDDQNDNDRHQQYRYQNPNHDSGNLTSTEDLCKTSNDSDKYLQDIIVI